MSIDLKKGDYYEGMIVTNVREHNDSYLLLNFCFTDYEGNPDQSKLWMLIGKHSNVELPEFKLSENGAHKGEFYTEDFHKVRYYIPERFYTYINQIKNQLKTT